MSNFSMIWISQFGDSTKMATLQFDPFTDLSMQAEFCAHYRRICGIAQTFKGQIFIWLAIHDQILIVENLNLRKRNWHEGWQNCTICKLHDESTSHLLLKCLFSSLFSKSSKIFWRLRVLQVPLDFVENQTGQEKFTEGVGSQCAFFLLDHLEGKEQQSVPKEGVSSSKSSGPYPFY